jgi:polyhydroxyalkanoate synthesis repressor PhaR
MSQTDQPTGGRRRAEGEPVVIKKYANRRLYNTASSSYVTLDHLAEMVRQGVDFVVYDAKTNEDLTRGVLTQIIFDEENRGQGQNLLPIQFLRQLISFYGDSMQAFLPSYLEMSLDGFAKQRERMQKDFGFAFGGAETVDRFQEQVRQNLQLFDRAMKMFSPFAYGRADGTEEPAASAAPSPAPAAAPAASDESLAEMKAQIEAMQKQLEKLISKKS